MPSMLLALILITGFFMGQSAFAECVILHPLENFENADLIFSGKVIDISQPSDFKTYNTFEMLQSWKGQPDNIITVRFDLIETCGLAFSLNEEYLVYATEFNGEFYTDSQRGTKSLNEAQEDMKFLDPPSGLINDVQTFTTDVQNIHPEWIIAFLIIASISLGLGFGIFYVLRKRSRKLTT